MQNDFLPQGTAPEFAKDFISVINALHGYAGHVSRTHDVAGLNALWEAIKTMESITGAYMNQPCFLNDNDQPNAAGRAIHAINEAFSYSLQLVAASMRRAHVGSDESERNMHAEVLLGSMIRWGADPKHVAEEAAKLASLKQP